MLYRYLLVVRFALINAVATGLLGAAYLQGWLDPVLNAHLVELSAIIFLVFLYGLVLCGVLVLRHGKELDNINSGNPSPQSQSGKFLARTKNSPSESRSILVMALRLKMTNAIVVVRNIANLLVLLGLIGTVIGFIIALSGVDPEAVSEVENVAAMISILISGMSVALNTTLVGSLLYVWLIINYGILTSGTVELITTVIETSESRALGGDAHATGP